MKNMKTIMATLLLNILLFSAYAKEKTLMTNKENPKAELIQAYHTMYKAMIEKDIAKLNGLLEEDYTLTHMTGYKQSRKEWLQQIESGQMKYHSTKEKSVEVELHGNKATLTGKNATDATIYGSRNTWNLQLKTEYEKKDGQWLAKETQASTF
jgi:hypothetical protein